MAELFWFEAAAGTVSNSVLSEILCLALVPSAPEPSYEDGLETVTQSGSGLGVKGFDGLLGLRNE